MIFEIRKRVNQFTNVSYGIVGNFSSEKKLLKFIKENRDEIKHIYGKSAIFVGLKFKKNSQFLNKTVCYDLNGKKANIWSKK